MMCKIQSFYLIDKVFIMGGDAARADHAIKYVYCDNKYVQLVESKQRSHEIETYIARAVKIKRSRHSGPQIAKELRITKLLRIFDESSGTFADENRLKV